MHQCQTCKKWFPRPSGLATHMNVHSGAKPFTCPVQSCHKKFAVRSNAKRHLQNNGVVAVPDTTRWIPQTLKERNLKLDDLDTCPLLISELSVVRPSTYIWGGEMVYEERDSFSDAPIAPYHPAYWRCLPGPAPTTAAALYRIIFLDSFSRGFIHSVLNRSSLGRRRIVYR
ncbi:hypothetical protein BC826DRAFT_271235 [Russula brevipes]|nr:hypothetical protein BC826DRAFT_271235 [Russula brevipes]